MSYSELEKELDRLIKMSTENNGVVFPHKLEHLKSLIPASPEDESDWAHHFKKSKEHIFDENHMYNEPKDLPEIDMQTGEKNSMFIDWGEPGRKVHDKPTCTDCDAMRVLENIFCPIYSLNYHKDTEMGWLISRFKDEIKAINQVKGEK